MIQMKMCCEMSSDLNSKKKVLTSWLIGGRFKSLSVRLETFQPLVRPRKEGKYQINILVRWLLFTQCLALCLPSINLTKIHPVKMERTILSIHQTQCLSPMWAHIIALQSKSSWQLEKRIHYLVHLFLNAKPVHTLACGGGGVADGSS